MTQLKRTHSAKELISEALCNLIEQKKKYQDISISDITKEAGVCRNSFYRNFNSKDDILKENFSNIVKQSDDLFIKSKTKTNYDLVYSITVVWKNNSRFLRSFYEANFRLYFDTTVKRILLSNTSESIDNINSHDYYLFASKAWLGIGLLTEWMLRNCDISVEEIAKLVSNLLENIDKSNSF